MTDSCEIHSADRKSYIDRVAGGWGVWWKGRRTTTWDPDKRPETYEPRTYRTREDARVAIRQLKEVSKQLSELIES